MSLLLKQKGIREAILDHPLYCKMEAQLLNRIRNAKLDIAFTRTSMILFKTGMHAKKAMLLLSSWNNWSFFVNNVFEVTKVFRVYRQMNHKSTLI